MRLGDFTNYFCDVLLDLSAGVQGPNPRFWPVSGTVTYQLQTKPPFAFNRNTYSRLPLVAWFGGWKGAASERGLGLANSLTGDQVSG
jgi:hypothetical protein